MIEEEYEEEDEVVNETVGKHRLNTPTAGKSKQFVEWLASRGLKHVDSHCTCGRRGTWWHGCAKKWYELDCFSTNIPITPGRWSKLNTFTMDGADHRGKDIMLQLEMRPATKARRIKKFEEKEKEEQVRRRIRWDKTRGGSQWAEDKKKEYRVALEERIEEMEKTPNWKELAEASDDNRGGNLRKTAHTMPGKHEARDSSHSKVRREQLLQGPRMQRSAKRD